MSSLPKQAIEIARHLVANTDLDDKRAREKTRDWLCTQLEEHLDQDSWGDANADSALEDIVVSATEQIEEALKETSGDQNGAPMIVKALIDDVMAQADIIVADAQDNLADNASFRRSPAKHFGVDPSDF